MATALRCSGGPLDGTYQPWGAQVVTFAEEPEMAYHRTRPTDTNWRDTYDRDWFMHGLNEPPPVPDRVYEWHERDWVSPEVAAIRGAYREAAARHR